MNPSEDDLRLEQLLAQVYVDATARARFANDPVGECRRAGLSEATAQTCANLDRAGLLLAASSFEAKRRGQRRVRAGAFPAWLSRLIGARKPRRP